MCMRNHSLHEKVSKRSMFVITCHPLGMLAWCGICAMLKPSIYIPLIFSEEVPTMLNDIFSIIMARITIVFVYKGFATKRDRTYIMLRDDLVDSSKVLCN
mgnify:CR=1 FL=1